MNRLLFERRAAQFTYPILTLCAFSREASAAQGCCLGILRALRPHAYVSLLLPLSVGVSSLCEILDFEMEEGAPALPPELPALLNRTMPEGIRVTKFYQSETKAGSACLSPRACYDGV
jgi:hypothetical protein